MKIVIYTTTECPYCKMLKTYLSEKSIQFEEKNTTDNPEIQREMAQLSDGFLGVPFTVIYKDDQVHKITGFDKPRFDTILEINN
jgi:glutaredoxin 3